MVRAQGVPVVALDADELRREIGRRVARRRVEIEMTQAELAHRIGVTFQQLYKYEIGKNNMSVVTMVAVCAALDVSPLTLLRGLSVPPLSPLIQYAPRRTHRGMKRSSKVLDSAAGEADGAR